MADTKTELPKEIEKEITDFDAGKLKHTETVEKNPLPSPDGSLIVISVLSVFNPLSSQSDI